VATVIGAVSKKAILVTLEKLVIVCAIIGFWIV
jgi:hypothetical protein